MQCYERHKSVQVSTSQHKSLVASTSQRQTAHYQLLEVSTSQRKGSKGITSFVKIEFALKIHIQTNMKVGGLTSIFQVCIFHSQVFWGPGKFGLKKGRLRGCPPHHHQDDNVTFSTGGLPFLTVVVKFFSMWKSKLVLTPGQTPSNKSSCISETSPDIDKNKTSLKNMETCFKFEEVFTGRRSGSD